MHIVTVARKTILTPCSTRTQKLQSSRPFGKQASRRNPSKRRENHLLTFLLLASFLLPLAPATAQLSGSRGGVPGSTGHGAVALPPLTPEVADQYITIEAQVELRVQPSEIRIVMAVTAEAETPAGCKQIISEKIKSLATAWNESGITKENIVEDFIAVLPRYEFQVESIKNREIAVEKKVGYLMQTNLHVAVHNDAEATNAINLAFDNNISDIIAFDYWSKELDELKIQARSQAVKAAIKKSNLLLDAIFDKRPTATNLQESTRVYYPESFYQSFSNSNDAAYQSTYSRRDLPQIRTFRPKNTYYRGLYLDADVQSNELPMKPAISVVSTVRLYFQSPAAQRDPKAATKNVNGP